jgi:hypothetical protein
MNDNLFHIFMHIPKTAGTTLRDIVDAQFGRKNVLTYYNQNSRQLLDGLYAILKMNDNYRAIIGHFSFGLHEKLEQPLTYITFLRHPVARTISQYKEMIANHPQYIQAADGSRMDLIESLRANPEYYEDYQTKHVVGHGSPFVNDPNVGEIALDILDEHFGFAGLVEYFDPSIDYMTKLFGWQRTEYEKRNVKPIEVEITPELVDAICSLNRNDLLIYDKIKSDLENNAVI